MKLLKKGAEADVYLASWDGKQSILKIRKEKKNTEILHLIHVYENKEQFERHK